MSISRTYVRFLRNFVRDTRANGSSPWRLVYSKNTRVSLAVRARGHGGGVVSLLAKIYLYRHLIEVGRDVRIGKGLKMPHPKNIIIADTAIIGDDVQINHGVTIGGSFKRSRLVEDQTRKIATIGNHVTQLDWFLHKYSFDKSICNLSF